MKPVRKERSGRLNTDHRWYESFYVCTHVGVTRVTGKGSQQMVRNRNANSALPFWESITDQILRKFSELEFKLNLVPFVLARSDQYPFGHVDRTSVEARNDELTYRLEP